MLGIEYAPLSQSLRRRRSCTGMTMLAFLFLLIFCVAVLDHSTWGAVRGSNHTSDQTTSDDTSADTGDDTSDHTTPGDHTGDDTGDHTSDHASDTSDHTTPGDHTGADTSDHTSDHTSDDTTPGDHAGDHTGDDTSDRTGDDTTPAGDDSTLGDDTSDHTTPGDHVAVGHAGNHTTVRCVDFPGMTHEPVAHTCLFRNLVIHDGELFAVMADDDHSPLTHPPVDMYTRSLWGVASKLFEPTLIPESKVGPVNRTESRLVLLSHQHHWGSYGNNIIDFCIPSATVMHLLGEETVDNVVLLENDEAFDAHALDLRVDTLITTNPLAALHPHAESKGLVPACPAGQWCRLARVVVGVRGLGLMFVKEQTPIRDAGFQTFRRLAWDHCGMSDVPHTPVRLVPHCPALVVKRTNTRKFHDIDLFTSRMQEAVRSHTGVDVDARIVNFSDLTMCEQVQEVAHACMMVGIEGSGFDNVYFARDGTGFLQFTIATSEHHAVGDVLNIRYVYTMSPQLTKVAEAAGTWKMLPEADVSSDAVWSDSRTALHAMLDEMAMHGVWDKA